MLMRLATGVPLAIGAMLIMAYPHAGFRNFQLVALLPIVFFTLREFQTLIGLRPAGRFTPAAIAGQLFALGLLAVLGLFAGSFLGGWLILLLLALAWLRIREFPTPEPFLQEPMRVVFSVLYVAGGFGALILLAERGTAWAAAGYVQNLGFNPVSIIPLVGTWCYDSAALGAGAATGTWKLAPQISPNKSIEGLIGGLAGVALGMVGLFALMVREGGLMLQPGLTPWVLIAMLGMLLGLASQLGDLFVSCLKREAHVKDSATLIPSQGGLMDKADGLLFVIPLTEVLLWVLGPFIWAHPL